MKMDKEIAEKLAKYEKMIEARRRGAEKTNSIPPEARKERAKKAAQARWSKK
jgi:hypothetical protein